MNGNKGLASGSVLAVVSASIGLAVSFGVGLSTAERDAIIAFATAIIAVAPSVGALFDHSHRQAKARIAAAQPLRAVSPPDVQLTTETQS